MLTVFQRRRILRFGDEGGSVNIMFAFSLLPMLGLLGLGVDYGVGEAVKLKLDNAADSAAVAAVATAKAYVAANPNDTNLTVDAIAAGMNRAGRAFTINAGSLPFATTPSNTGVNSGSTCNVATLTAGALQIGLVRSTDGTTFTSCVAYKTQTQNHFGTFFRNPTLTESGSTSASASIPLYLDFYLLVDVSGSMGLPANASDQTKMLNAVGCQFACHFPGSSAGWNYAQQNSIVLRSGAVNTAVCALLSTASTPAVANEYRVGVYPFATMMGTLAPLSATIATVQSQTGCNQATPTTFTSLLDTGTTQLGTTQYYIDGTGSGGTDFNAIFPTMQTTISSFGNGASSTNSKPFVFLITDGMENTQAYATHNVNYQGQQYYFSNYWFYAGSGNNNFPNVNWMYGKSSNNTGNTTQPQVINPSICSNLKNAGATIAILYIPYQPLAIGSNISGVELAEDQQANAAIPNLPSTLTSCASTGYFYTANSPSDITNALQQMFQHAIQTTHLTQ